ncbi:MAG TPA: prepilin-type N-terminal cleavage/methylation domain-containing protein [Gemmatimonadales bacterium]|nr:prepilin-type N-terminal cleavage/methylation domain-containing protein [Gemmatimonadales bacterium]
MSRRAGFTLIELLVAIAVAGTVLLLAHALFGAVESGVLRARGTNVEIESEAAGMSWMEEVFHSVEIGRPPDGAFEGSASAVAFTGYLRTPGGWPERRRIELHARSGRLLMLAGVDTLVLWQGVDRMGLDYLLEPGANVRWVNEWQSPVSAPLAVRVRLQLGPRVDTMLFIIGARG